MIAYITHLPIFILDAPLQTYQSLAQMHHLTLNPDLLTRGHRTQIPAIQIPAHMARIPEAFFSARRQRRRSADVEDEGDGTAVQGPGHWCAEN
jgi:hypothetical protein